MGVRSWKVESLCRIEELDTIVAVSFDSPRTHILILAEQQLGMAPNDQEKVASLRKVLADVIKEAQKPRVADDGRD